MSQRIKGLTERYPAQLIMPVVDILTVISGGLLAYWSRFGDFNLPERFVLVVALLSLLIVVLNSAFGAYQRWRTKKITTLVFRLFLVWLIAAMLVISVIYFTYSAHRYSRLWVGLSLALSFFFAAGIRVFIQLFLRHIRIKGLATKSVFLIGPGENITSVGKNMRGSPAEGYVLAGIQRIKNKLSTDELSRVADRITESGAQEVWLCMSITCANDIRDIIYALRNHTVELRFIPDFGGIDIQLLNHRVNEIAGLYSIDLSVSPISGVARFVKRLEDLLVGSLICLLISPICLLIALAIKLSSPGPVLFKQYRTGVNGANFKVYKFRSMKVHQEVSGSVTQATKGDSRITPIGNFLRRTSLDELPQFFNVIQGRMSIVGPRPHALAHNEYYKDLVESYMKRHKVKPGITGWAQVNGLRGETDTLDKMEKRVQYDLWYIDNWSLWLDMKIIFLTIFKGFINKNAY
ncbi:undecaprenyl-phosphate glucose phosphotransferase [uncultured Tolumonas sp.]|uniref:undecaprenyl-phosphate glucose phosphotransferase n=1 Tax=uncultured Tolumonas sp. TaxID=263765 RepID=UPI002A0A5F0A|nr:undecaprenyl-phosphate glucose phosphotransferase [uncultured Tolumonas sp.]